MLLTGKVKGMREIGRFVYVTIIDKKGREVQITTRADDPELDQFAFNQDVVIGLSAKAIDTADCHHEFDMTGTCAVCGMKYSVTRAYENAER